MSIPEITAFASLILKLREELGLNKDSSALNAIIL
jgi:hypothetical protein